MFKLSEIKELIKLVDQSSLQELEIENEGSRLLIRKPNKTESILIASPSTQSMPAQAQPTYIQQTDSLLQLGSQHSPAASTEGTMHLYKIVAPMVGTFYQSSSPGSASFVNIGDKVHEKSVVCIVEAMKLMNEIEAEVKGEIVQILVENGQLVEYGQPLFLVKQGV